jgi:DNA end-binding protein Ku
VILCYARRTAVRLHSIPSAKHGPTSRPAANFLGRSRSRAGGSPATCPFWGIPGGQAFRAKLSVDEPLAHGVVPRGPPCRRAIRRLNPFSSMRAIWKGSINFGLVNIPISLFSAVRREELSFRLLRSTDLSPINYKRVAEADGREVPWEQIVKGYEYEKGKFVILKDDDFKRVDVEATQSVDIIDFVELREVNPMFFYKPYYIEPQKNGAKAYALLRDVLKETGKAGISKVVIKTRQHLAALRPDGDVLVLELMHFADDLVGHEGIRVPEAGQKAGAKEMAMAKTLVDQMSDKWDPERYTDDYTSALMKLIDEKVESGGKLGPAPKPKKPASNVIDLVSVLERSLAQSGKGESGKAASKKSAATNPAAKKRARKKAA